MSLLTEFGLGATILLGAFLLFAWIALAFDSFLLTVIIVVCGFWAWWLGHTILG